MGHPVTRLLPIMLLAGCAARPDAYTGVMWDSPRPSDVESAEWAAKCLKLAGMPLPERPFAGVHVHVSDGDARHGAAVGPDMIAVSATDDRALVLAHEFVHIALLRYSSIQQAHHHQWMSRAGLCFGGCASEPLANPNMKGCE
jgi:hypothetical protein